MFGKVSTYYIVQLSALPCNQCLNLQLKGGSKGGSRTAATPKMERFVIIVNGFQPLTIITKRSILDVAAVLDPPLGRIYQNVYNKNINFEEQPFYRTPPAAASVFTLFVPTF